MMTPDAPTEPSLPRLEELLKPFGQEHLLADWPRLSGQQRRNLAAQIATLDLPLLQSLFTKIEPTHESSSVASIEPFPVIGLPSELEDWQRQQAAGEAGEDLLAAGKVAIVLVAGGQGSRLGFEGPKGAFPIGPLTGNSLFQLSAEQVAALSRRYGQALPLLVMTSAENDAATRAFFAARGCFGLAADQVTFFQQGMMPALDATTGRILRTAPDQIAFSPNGHGGALEALHRAGHLRRLKAQGIASLFYFQVDNPLVKVADPVFLGLHQGAGAEMSVKVVRKTDPAEAIGLVVLRDGKPGVIEYSEIGAEVAALRARDGGLRYWAGNTAIHVFSLDFLLRLAEARTMLPYHRALKAMNCLDEAGQLVKPAGPNAFKFEMFIFDAMPQARKVLAVETDRAEEFEPLKNAAGAYSPELVKRAISARCARWLGQAGVRVRVRDGPTPPLEISPLFAYDAEELRAKLAGMAEVAGPLYLGPDFQPPPVSADAHDEED